MNKGRKFKTCAITWIYVNTRNKRRKSIIGFKIGNCIEKKKMERKLSLNPFVSDLK